jgi:hypothetical protein
LEVLLGTAPPFVVFFVAPAPAAAPAGAFLPFFAVVFLRAGGCRRLRADAADVEEDAAEVEDDDEASTKSSSSSSSSSAW